jgi:penicillin-binding protein 1A
VDKIYTNLEEIPEDRSVQQLQSSMVIIDNRTGDIIAMAGGVGEKAYHDAYNRATDAKLQPGSSIKPLTVFAPAIELGIMNPGSLVYDLPLYYDEDTPFPRNDTRDYVYTYSMLQGLVYSINAISGRAGIPIERNKRNGRRQETHLKIARAHKQILKEAGELERDGRPSSEMRVKRWRLLHPEGTKSQCKAETGMSYTTIAKWWDT